MLFNLASKILLPENDSQYLFVVRRMAKKFGMKPVGDEEDWTIFWTDTTIVNDRISDMKRYQVCIPLRVGLAYIFVSTK